MESQVHNLRTVSTECMKQILKAAAKNINIFLY